MKTEHYSTVIIGAGSGGMTVAVGLSSLGHKVAMVEAQYVGGDCTNVGCVPSKTLIHLAKNFKPGDDPDQVLQEVTRKRDALRDLETEEVQEMENLTFIQGWAEFSGQKSLSVTRDEVITHQLTADQIVIATGARPRLLDIPGLSPERSPHQSQFIRSHPTSQTSSHRRCGCDRPGNGLRFPQTGRKSYNIGAGSPPLNDGHPRSIRVHSGRIRKARHRYFLRGCRPFIRRGHSYTQYPIQ